jgi:hypothetical protein
MDGSSKPEFDTGCLKNEASTFELTQLRPGEDRTVLFEAFDASSCDRSARIATGLRGGITISEEDPGRYFIPIYDAGDTTALPEALNISSNAAVALDFCEQGESCDDVSGAAGLCKLLKDAVGDLHYWCVPTCETDAECTGLHPKSTCDTDTSYCMIHHPYPLNMSSARALGQAITAENGDVVLLGGFTRDDGDRLVAGDWAFERFNAATGLFDTMAFHSPEYPAHGLAGIAHMSGDWFAFVGGARSVGIQVSGTGPALTLDLEGLAEPFCPEGSEPDCTTANLSARILFFHASSGAGVVTNGAVDPVAQPAVVGRPGSNLLIIGGWKADGDVASRSTDVHSCTYNEKYEVSCSTVGALSTGRAGAVALCLGSECDQVLVVGGNAGEGAIAEILLPDEPAAPSLTLDSDDLPNVLSWLVLCGDAIVSGSSAESGVGDLAAVTLSVDEDGLTVVTLADEGGHGASLGASVAMAADGSCFVSGGLAGDGGLSRSVVHAVDGGLAPNAYELSRGRFGAASAVVGAGPLEGSVVIAGGLAISADGTRVEMVHGAEILQP